MIPLHHLIPSPDVTLEDALRQLADAVNLTTPSYVSSQDQQSLRYYAMAGKSCETEVFEDDDEATATPEQETVLVFLCGLGGTTIGALPYLLGLRHEFHHVISHDLRGFGVNDQHSCLFDPAHVYRKDLDSFFTHLKRQYPTARITLAGISLGALLATIAVVDRLVKHPIDSVLLLAPAFAPHPETFPPTMVMRMTGKFLASPNTAMMTMPYNLKQLTKNSLWLTHPQVSQDPLTLPLKYLLSVNRLTAHGRKQLAKLQIPTLLLVPEADRVCCPSTMQKAYLELPTNILKRLSMFPGVYHDLLLEPELPQIVEETLSWLYQVNLWSLAAQPSAETAPSSATAPISTPVLVQ